MASSSFFPTPSPFFEAPFQAREKGFGERFADDLTNLTLKQGLGLPFSVPLELGTGALKGVSFGLLDFGEQSRELLGEFALPETLNTAVDIAGEIGGSFVPFIGASNIASKVFKGISLGHKLARGSFTFGAPEVLRQGLLQEVDPQRGARSIATGAAFALPLPRYALAPAVAGTELLFGADPVEAIAAGGFAALFGSMSGKHGLNQEVPVERLGLPNVLPGTSLNPLNRPPRPGVSPSSADVLGASVSPGPGASRSNFTVPRATAQTPGPTAPIPEVRPNALSELMEAAKLRRQKPTSFRNIIQQRPEGVAEFNRGAATIGAIGATGAAAVGIAIAAPLSQVGLIQQASANAPNPDAARELQNLARTVAEAQQLPEESLMVAFNKSLDEAGGEAAQTQMLRMALAQKQQGFVPAGAPVKNILPKARKGVDLTETDPTKNPFLVRARQEQVLTTLRANGGFSGRTKAAEIEELQQTAREVTARARGRGQEPTPDQITDLIKRQEQIMAGTDVTFASEAHAMRVGLQEMGNLSTAADVDAFLAELPTWYQPIKEQLLTAGRDQKRVLVMAEKEMQPMKQIMARQPEGFSELMAEASDAGMAAMPKVAGGTGTELTLQGQTVRNFANPTKAREWIQSLQAGTVEPANVHELRALGFSRGLVVDHTGRGTLDITNNLTGETIQGVTSMAEAVRVVRQAPDLRATAQEIGPRVSRLPAVPGTGGIGGLATEQSPPLARCGPAPVE